MDETIKTTTASYNGQRFALLAVFMFSPLVEFSPDRASDNDSAS